MDDINLNKAQDVENNTQTNTTPIGMDKPQQNQGQFNNQPFNNQFNPNLPNLGWSWAGFLNPVIYGAACYSWPLFFLGLFIPLVGSIVGGICGRKWAWYSGKFQTVQEFETINKCLTRAFVIQLVVVAITFVITYIFIFVIMGISILGALAGLD